jgi:DNA-binding transcriptional LysR family regulator
MGRAMLDLNDFYYFVQIIDRGGFTSASRSLNIPKSTLSYRMRHLESNLGVRLINRTSRQFSATDVGNEFYRHAVSMLRQADAAEYVVRQRVSEPSGVIRFTTAFATSQFAMREMIPGFVARYPKVLVVQHASDAFVDIVAENFDVAIRAHSEPLADSTLVKRTLAPAPWCLFAAPGYLERIGHPQTPEDLRDLDALLRTRHGSAPSWRLRLKGQHEVTIPNKPRLLSDDLIGLKQCANAGLGIVSLPAYVCREEVRTGSLVRVLPAWTSGDSTLTALIPYRQGMLPSVRAFVDFISAEFPKVVAL